MVFADLNAQSIAILGCQWGDEGKGKLVDIIAEDADYVVRATGGANAGHTIYTNGQKFVFHLMPSGILHQHTHCVIGNGCVVHIETLLKELENLNAANIDYKGRLFISDQASVLFDFHKHLDGQSEQNLKTKKIGTTKRGIGPAYTDKISRFGLKFHDLKDMNLVRSKLEYLFVKYDLNTEYNLDEVLSELEQHYGLIQEYIVDSVDLIQTAYKQGKKVIFEGANGALLDIDHGTFPYVTSSNSTLGGLATGTGFPVNKMGHVCGIVKAYTTRVGGGPFPAELEDEVGQQLRDQGHEYGSTTGRPRRCGWLDLAILKRVMFINGVDSINLTKLDVLMGIPKLQVITKYLLDGKEIHRVPELQSERDRVEFQTEEFEGFTEDISRCQSYSELPLAAQKYIEFIEEFLQVPVKFIGVGKDRTQLIFR